MSMLSVILLFAGGCTAGLLIPKKLCERHRAASGLLGILASFFALLLGLGLFPKHPVAAAWIWLAVIIALLILIRPHWAAEKPCPEPEPWRRSDP